MRIACRMLAGVLFLTACSPAAKPTPEPVAVYGQDQINWGKFLSDQDPVWTRLSDQWRDGAFLGNGLLGAMAYLDGTAPTAPIKFELGRTDVTAHERIAAVDWSVPRVPIGDLLLQRRGRVARRR